MLRRFLERITTPSEIAFIQPLVASIKAKTLKQSKDKIHGLVLKLDVVMLNEKLETERTECIGVSYFVDHEADVERASQQLFRN